MNSDVERGNTRLYHRYQLATPVILTTLGPGQPEIVLGRTLEMSEAGVGGLFTSRLAEGAIVRLELTLPLASQPISIEAILRNRVGYRYGFEFAALSIEHRETVTKACRSLSVCE